MSDIDAWAHDIHCGDAIETLEQLPASSVHCCMTSPPYFGLRDYGVDGQLGLEESLDEYIENLVDVGAAIRRVLRDDGSWWLNLGDSFGDGKQKMLVPHRVASALQDAGWVVRNDVTWVKPNPMPSAVKDRLNTTTEQVFHLTPSPDYWYDLDAIREPHKAESLERAARGYTGTKTTRVEHMPGRETESRVHNFDRGVHPNGKNPGDVFEVTVQPFSEAHFAVYPPELCETPLKATAPPEVCVDCGTPYEREVETTPLWDRDIQALDRPQQRKALERFQASDLTVAHLQAARSVGFGDGAHGDAAQGSRDRVDDRTRKLADEAKQVLGGYFREFVHRPERDATGWGQTCDCDTDATEAGIVLDPFAGAGTTCLVAKRLGRRFIGIDLNPEYVALAQQRVGLDVDEPERLLEEGETHLQAFTDGGEP
ncbi:MULTISPECIES: DNA-methyltransferase [Haloglomus]|uniref:DNA-methyltransferase n=1 Tax=Haloglomus TaxID=2806252 RepID=UPI0020C9753C|nr:MULTISPECIES: site-specific DNA-methyltransferase [Haloglomus]